MNFSIVSLLRSALPLILLLLTACGGGGGGGGGGGAAPPPPPSSATVAPLSAAANTTAQKLTVLTAMASFTPLTASGGATPYTYSHTGILPTGLSLNASTGAVTGTPSAAYAAANLVFSVKDSNNAVASTTSTVSFSVVLPLSATANTTAQNLTVGTAMASFTPLTASDGATPYTYSYVGILPAGLSYNTGTGVVTGIPSAAYAKANVVFSVKDANGNVAGTTSTVSFSVLTATATNTAQNLTFGVPMTSFTPLTASGGTAPYTYSVTGTLPAGLSLNSSTGAMTGTPLAAYAAAKLVFSAKDANGTVASTTSGVSFSVALPVNYISQGGLTWMPVTLNSTWGTAFNSCTTAISGVTGWRMPTSSELGSLITSGLIPATGWTLGYTWTSDLNSANSAQANMVYIGATAGGIVQGSSIFGTLTGTGYYTCVRDAAVHTTSSLIGTALPTGYVTQGGLVWMPATTSSTWGTAAILCTTTINGVTGWRMPTGAELVSLVTSGITRPGWSGNATWASDLNSVNSAQALTVTLSNGTQAVYALTSAYIMACVHP